MVKGLGSWPRAFDSRLGRQTRRAYFLCRFQQHQGRELINLCGLLHLIMNFLRLSPAERIKWVSTVSDVGCCTDWALRRSAFGIWRMGLRLHLFVLKDSDKIAYFVGQFHCINSTNEACVYDVECDRRRKLLQRLNKDPQKRQSFFPRMSKLHPSLA